VGVPVLISLTKLFQLENNNNYASEIVHHNIGLKVASFSIPRPLPIEKYTLGNS
jgi:hypothetical protein